MVDRLAGVAVPHDGGLALVGNADGGDILGGGTDLVHGREGHAQLGGPDLVGIMLDPARFWINLLKLFLRYTANISFFVKLFFQSKCFYNKHAFNGFLKK